MRNPRPFVKWAGGKRKLAEKIVGSFPPNIARYWEPFVGGGAVFFTLKPHSATLSDINQELINAYTMIADHPESVIASLAKRESLHSRKYYLEVRANPPSNRVEQASRFIYLNKTCFNGLYRVNSSGGFNVPMGNYKNPCIVDAENIRAVSEALEGVVLASTAYESATPEHGDVVYCDLRTMEHSRLTPARVLTTKTR